LALGSVRWSEAVVGVVSVPVQERAMALTWAALRAEDSEVRTGFVLAEKLAVPRAWELAPKWARGLAAESALRLGVGLEWMRARAKVAGLALDLALP